MNTFCLAVLWGLGVSLGASVGVFAFVMLKAAFDWMCGRDVYKSIAQANEDSLQALQRRNELTVEIISSLDHISEAIDRPEGDRIKIPLDTQD